MGISSATEIFKHVMENHVLKGLKGVKNLIDDIIVYGRDKNEHDKNLKALLDRLESLGMTA